MKALIPLSTFPQRRFLLKNSSWIFSRKFICGFSFNCSFTDFFSKILSRIFFQLFFGGFSFENSSVDFLSNILFGFSFKYGNARPYKKSVDGGSFWWNSFPGLHKKQWKLSYPCLFSLKMRISSNILRRFSLEYFFADFLSNILSRIFFRIFFRGFSLEYSFPYGYARPYKNQFLTELLPRALH